MPGVLTPLQISLGMFLTQNQGLAIQANALAAGGTYLSLSTPALMNSLVSTTANALSNGNISKSTSNNINQLNTAFPALLDQDPNGSSSRLTDLLLTHMNQILPSTDYTKFVQVFGLAQSSISQTNTMIQGALDATEYLGSTFTTMDEMTTGGFSNVSTDLRALADDLAACGNALNLQKLDQLGRPSLVIATLKDVGNEYIGFKNELLVQGIPESVIKQIGKNNFLPSMVVEKQIFAAMKLVKKEQLSEILDVLNCTTPRILDLSEVLNISIMLPNSFLTLLGITSKGPVPIYTDPGVRSILEINNRYASVNEVFSSAAGELKLATRPDLAATSRTFARSLQQIKKIAGKTTVQISQAMRLLETNTNLPAVESLESPISSEVANLYSSLATGSGANGTFVIADAIGTVGGYVITANIVNVNSNLESILSTGVAVILTDSSDGVFTVMINTLNGVYGNNPCNIAGGFGGILPGWFTSGGGEYATIDAAFSTVGSGLIDLGQAQISAVTSSIASTFPSQAQFANTAWSNVGNKYITEIAILNYSGVDLSTVTSGPVSTTMSWVSGFGGYSKESGPGATNEFIQRIANITDTAGQMVVAALREQRNISALQQLGIPTDNQIG